MGGRWLGLLPGMQRLLPLLPAPPAAAGWAVRCRPAARSVQLPPGGLPVLLVLLVLQGVLYWLPMARWREL
jgi:hypothetical protein